MAAATKPEVTLTALLMVFLVTTQPIRVFAMRGTNECRLGDISPVCRAILPKDCYATGMKLRCCDTCNAFAQQLFVGNGCEYGDHELAFCRLVRARHCESAYTRSRCCATCSVFKMIPNWP